MNETIQLLLRHRSIRKFKSEPVTEAQLAAIIDAAQMASTSSNMQACSVINVTEPDLKRKLAEYAGNQKHVEECPLFLVWCADLYRLVLACRQQGLEPPSPGTMENLIVATVDVALAAQNAAVAAESLGLGIVYIGGIRNHPEQVCELLGLPELVYPVFGMCFGVPDQSPVQRPRLPRKAVYHMNRYDKSALTDEIQSYDELYREYMRERTRGKRIAAWSEEMAAKMQQPSRMHMKAFLQQRGFAGEE